MNERKKSVFSNRKVKIAGLTLCAALMLTVGALTVLAATSENFPNFHLFFNGERISGFSVRSDGEGTSFSTDGGETWNDTVPEGMTYTEGTTEDGVYRGVLAIEAEAEFDTIDLISGHIGASSGHIEVSSDFIVTFDGNTEVYYEEGGYPSASSSKLFGEEFAGDIENLHILRVDVFEETIYYSLDDGETWVEGFPDGMVREGRDEIEYFFGDGDGFVSFRYTVDDDK